MAAHGQTGLVEHESASRGQEAELHHHVVPIPVYLMVFGILMVGTVLTVAAAVVDFDFVFPGANTLIALLIALIKTSFVVLFFMHVKYSGRLIWLSVIGGGFWLLIMFAFTMQDYLTRSPGTFAK
jgi:cytochrome c oxidase subunit 4